MPSTIDPADEGTRSGPLPHAGNAQTITGPVAPPHTPHPPPTIPGYRVVRELGRGGMGEVYEVISEKLNVTFALKTIRPDRVSQRFLNRFLAEARTMTQLDHPHIARIYFYGETDDGPYFTMRYLPDGTLDDRMAALQRDPRRAVGMMADIAGAVDYLHTQGFIHRDLKPHNILFVNDTPYVSDFGLAKAFGDDLDGDSSYSSGARTGTVDDLSRAETRVRESRGPAPATHGAVGTLPYMSPEQLLNRGEKISARTDIWALGVILYEMLAGRRPFEAEDRDVLSELIKCEEPHPIQTGNASADPELNRIVRKCLAKNPSDRYASASELERDLRGWLGASLQDSQPGIRRPNWFVRHPLLSVAGLLTIAAVAFFGIRYWPRPASGDDPLAQAKKDLAAGRPVTFIGANWPARLPLDVIAGKDRAIIREAADRTVTVEAFEPILVQFFDDPGIDSYTFRVEVRYNGVDSLERVGIYAGHQEFSTPDGDKHFFLPMTFTDFQRGDNEPKGSKLAPQQPSGLREIQAALLESRVGAPGSFNPFTFRGGARPFPRPKRDGEGAWHKLEIVARADQWTFNFDGATAVTVPIPIAQHVLAELQRFHKGAEPLPLRLNARGGLGLFILSGSASFRNAEIIPNQVPAPVSD